MCCIVRSFSLIIYGQVTLAISARVLMFISLLV